MFFPSYVFALIYSCFLFIFSCKITDNPAKKPVNKTVHLAYRFSYTYIVSTNSKFLTYRLNNTLSHHSIYNFFKSCNISAHYVVSFLTVTFCSIVNVVCDIYHNLL